LKDSGAWKKRATEIIKSESAGTAKKLRKGDGGTSSP
jgi:hypothetical protein